MEPSALAAMAARRLPPEFAHSATISALARGIAVPSSPPSGARSHPTKLPVSGLVLPNPVGLAAGFDKDAQVFSAMLAFGFGFVECGTVTPRPQAGNPRPRLFRLREDKGVINRMGFNNGGLDDFVARLQGRDRSAGIVGANVGANKDSPDRTADYVTGLEAVWPYADYVALNISSPNTPGLRGLQDKGALDELLGRCGEAAMGLAASKGFVPIFLKVAPDLDDHAIGDIAAAAKQAPFLHGLIVSNTTLARPETLRSRHANEAGGLSGAPLREASTRVLSAFSAEIDGALDLIGVGGVSSAEDVREKLAAGASAVQLYSALAFEGPGLIGRILDQL
ncbi:MAG: quinone-dependent dihydroorotate dehydrogenase [Pseudomonadota bacterium]